MMLSSITFLTKGLEKKYQFVIGYIALFFECVTPIIALIIQKDLINQVFIDKNYDKFLYLIALYGIFFFAPKLFFTLRKVIFFNIRYMVQKHMTYNFLHKIYDLPTQSSDKEHTGKLLHHLRTDIGDVCELGINTLMSESVKVLFSIFLLTVTIGFLNIKLLFLVLVISLAYYLLLKFFGEKTKLYAKQVRQEQANVSIAVEESVSGLKELVSYNRESWQVNKYKNQFQAYYEAILSQVRYKIKTFLVSDPLLYITKLIVIFIGALSIMKNKTSLGEFVISFTLVDLLITELGLLFEHSLTIKRFTASKNILEDIFNEENESFGDVGMDTIQTIDFENVSFSYQGDGKKVLDNISVSFPIGKKIALVGESGCGKSTIASILTRRLKCDDGKVLLNGLNISTYNETYKEFVTIVLQSPHFLPYSIIDNLKLQFKYKQSYIDSICSKMLCKEFIDDMPRGYETFVGENGTTLSGGQKQRLALSRAILRDSEVLILDEATSALDTETEYLVQENIDKLRKNKTTFIIAHRLSTIQNADIIYVMDKGKIVDQGDHDTLLNRSEIYRKLTMKATV